MRALDPSVASAATPLLAIAGQSTEPVPASRPAKAEPFAFADWTWLNGNPRTKEAAFDSKFFTPEIRADINYVYDFNHPQDDTIGGSSEVFRSDEVHVTQLGVGGDFHYDNVRARVMTQFGLYSEATPRNDASPARGQWDLADAYRYCPKLMADTISTRCTGSMSTRGFSFHISVSSVITTSITGHINLRLCRQTRRGFQWRACANLSHGKAEN